MLHTPARRLLLAGLATGIIDGLFASAQTFFYKSTVTRLWQAVASTLLGKAAYDGGTRTALIGVLMHFGVAFGWSAVFLLLYARSRWIQSVADSPGGVFKVAAVYGPLVWMTMSLMVIPLLVQRPPNITGRWWIQLVGHVFFVGLPIVYCIAGRRATSPAAASAPLA